MSGERPIGGASGASRSEYLTPRSAPDALVHNPELGDSIAQARERGVLEKPTPIWVPFDASSGLCVATGAMAAKLEGVTLPAAAARLSAQNGHPPSGGGDALPAAPAERLRYLPCWLLKRQDDRQAWALVDAVSDRVLAGRWPLAQTREVLVGFAMLWLVTAIAFTSAGLLRDLFAGVAILRGLLAPGAGLWLSFVSAAICVALLGASAVVTWRFSVRQLGPTLRGLLERSAFFPRAAALDAPLRLLGVLVALHLLPAAVAAFSDFDFAPAQVVPGLTVLVGFFWASRRLPRADVLSWPTGQASHWAKFCAGAPWVALAWPLLLDLFRVTGLNVMITTAVTSVSAEQFIVHAALFVLLLRAPIVPGWRGPIVVAAALHLAAVQLYGDAVGLASAVGVMALSVAISSAPGVSRKRQLARAIFGTTLLVAGGRMLGELAGVLLFTPLASSHAASTLAVLWLALGWHAIDARTLFGAPK